MLFETNDFLFLKGTYLSGWLMKHKRGFNNAGSTRRVHPAHRLAEEETVWHSRRPRVLWIKAKVFFWSGVRYHYPASSFRLFF